MELREFIHKTLITTLNENLVLIRGVGKNESGNVELFGKGLYLTDDMDVAKFYGDSIHQFNITGNIYDTSKSFSSAELRKFMFCLDSVLNTSEGSKYIKNVADYHGGKIPKNTDIDYVGISWALDSTKEFMDVLEKNNLNTNSFNSYANVCTAMNLALNKMGYVGLKYSTSEIDDLDDNGLGSRNAYVIFNKNAINQI